MVTQLPNLDGAVFDALGDPTRRAILELLRGDGRPAGDIAAHFPISRPAVAKHVRILKDAGLLQEHVDGRNRIYSLNAAPLVEVDQWLQPFRAFWTARLVSLKHLIEQQEQERDNGSV